MIGFTFTSTFHIDNCVQKITRHIIHTAISSARSSFSGSSSSDAMVILDSLISFTSVSGSRLSSCYWKKQARQTGLYISAPPIS